MSSVNLVYFYPNDQAPPPNIAATVRDKMLSVQRYYADQLGGRTFSMSEVRIVEGLWPTVHYGAGLEAWGRVLEDIAFQQAAPDSCSPPYAILVCFTHPSVDLNGGTPCGNKLGPSGTWHYAADGGGLALFTEEALTDTGRWVEHEVGHAFTLPHTPSCEYAVPTDAQLVGHPERLDYATCTYAIMQSAWNYDGGFLDTDDAPEKRTLLAHPLMDMVLGMQGPNPEPVEPLPEPDPDLIPEPPRPPKLHGKGWDKGGKGWGRGGKK